MNAARAGLFLDLDGTLADSLGAMREAYGAFLRSFGKEGTDAEFDRLNGPTLKEVPLLLAKTHGLAGSPEKLQEKYISFVKEAYKNVRPSKGAERLLAAAKERGIVCVLVTSNVDAVAHAWLDMAKLSQFFAHVIGMDAIERGKPAPDIYLAALRVSGCEPSRVLAVEDSKNGVLAAKSAGLAVAEFQSGGDLGAIISKLDGVAA